MRILAAISVVIILALAGSYLYKVVRNKREKSAVKIDKIELDGTLNISVVVERECQLGDFDIMAADLALNGKASDPDLLISLEPIVAGDSPGVSTRVSLDQLERGYAIKLPLPKLEEPRHLGVFICRDRQKTGTCANKALFNFGEIQASVNHGGDQNVRKNDKVFFYQHIYVKDRAAYFLTDAVESLEDAYKRIDMVTADTKDETERTQIRSRSKALYNALGSYVVTKRDPSRGQLFLEARLSKRDEQLCRQPSIKPPQRSKINRRAPVPSVFRKLDFKNAP